MNNRVLEFMASSNIPLKILKISAIVMFNKIDNNKNHRFELKIQISFIKVCQYFNIVKI